eukprot:COSAG02_NODE_4547_length_5227_cov_54.893721_4_plen_201_part_00
MNTANTSRYAGMPPDTDASIQALAAGVDQDLGGYSYGSLIPATKAGLVPKAVAGQHGIDEACSNVLRSKFAAGLFDQPYTDPVLLEQIDSHAHRALAKDAAIDGATLLQNLGGVLPKHISQLKKVVSSVAILEAMAFFMSVQLVESFDRDTFAKAPLTLVLCVYRAPCDYVGCGGSVGWMCEGCGPAMHSAKSYGWRIQP